MPSPKYWSRKGNDAKNRVRHRLIATLRRPCPPSGAAQHLKEVHFDKYSVSCLIGQRRLADFTGYDEQRKNIFDIITLKDFAEDFGGADGVDGVEMI